MDTTNEMDTTDQTNEMDTTDQTNEIKIKKSFLEGKNWLCVSKEERRERRLAGFKRYNDKIFHCEVCNKNLKMSSRVLHLQSKIHKELEESFYPCY